jgi:hypothetical protein
MFAALREQLFTADPRAMTGGAAGGADEVVGVVVEIGMPQGTALVFALRDGTASVYLSSGGGSIGGHDRPNINAAARRLVGLGQGLVATLAPAAEHPLPAAGRIRFSVLTPAGVRAAEVAEAEVFEGAHQLRPLFIGANQIITGFRLADEGAKPNEGLYVNLLLTALARGHAASVTLTAGEPLPDPATLTNDQEDLDWLSSLALDPRAQSSEKTVNRLLEAAGFRRFHLRRTEGQIRTSLQANDGSGARDFDFKVTKSTTADGRVRVEITPVRPG